MSGAWIFVCGPSGAGKDSVIALAQQTIGEHQDIVFARRLVTRPAQAGSDHDPVSEAQFHALRQAGGLRWHWQAHGFHYAIAARYAADVQAGRRVVVNGSRAHVQGLSPSAEVRRVEVTASPALLAARLAGRDRDTASAVANRLARGAACFGSRAANCVIVNDAELAVAAQRLADYLTGD